MPFFLHIKACLHYCSWLTTLLFFMVTHTTAQLTVNFTVNQSGGCAPFTASFTNTTTGASANAILQWDLGNGNTAAVANPGAIYTGEKIYTITLTVKDGTQTASKTQQVTVYKKPTVDFAPSITKECIPTPVTFTSTSSAGSGAIAGYYWDFGDGYTQQGPAGSQSHSYNITQKATVGLTVTNSYGCHSTLQKKDIVELIPGINAGFSADKRILCLVSDPVQLSNSSSGPGTLSYVWDFGDGNTSTAATPAHAFNKKGIYTVKLTVKSSAGCTATNTQTGFINVATYSTDFDGPSKICQGDYATFNNRGTPSPNNTIWEINGVTVSYYYANLYQAFYTPGDFTLKLTNTYGTCMESVSNQISVKKVPDLQGYVATPAGLCGAPMVVNFKDTTPGAVQWKWEFDYYNSGAVSNAQNPSYTYTSDGLHDVGLQVTNADGCSSYSHRSVIIPKPSVTISYTSSTSLNGLTSCGPVTIGFTSNASEPITQYKWIFGDGGISAGPSPSHLFSIPGNYQVQLQYTTQNGCTGTAYLNTVIMNKMPVVDIIASRTEACGNVPITFTPVPNDRSVTSWSIEFGDGSLINGPGNMRPVPYGYLEAGWQTLKVVARNSACDTVFYKPNLVNIKPPEAFLTGYANTCDGTRGEVTFTHASRGAATVTWNFGDGTPTVSTPASQTAIKHTYARSGGYTAILTATKDQCSVTAGSPVYVYLKQQPKLTTNTPQLCTDQSMQYTVSNIERVTSGVVTWSDYYYFEKWEYPDGSIFPGPTAGYIDQNGGPFSAALNYPKKESTQIRAIISAKGFACQDTTNFITYKIQQGPQAGFEVVKDDVCFKDAVMLKDTSKSFGSTITSRAWTFGDGGTSTQSGTVSHVYNNPGAYYAGLTVTDASGCTTSTNSYSTRIDVHGPKAAFHTSGTNVPLSTTVYFYNNTNAYNAPNTTYQWDFGNGVTSTASNPSYTFNQPGTFIIKLTATDPVTGCSSEAPPVTITVRDFVSAFSVYTSSITGKSCPPVLAQFTNNSSNYTRVTWDFGDGITADNLYSPSHIYEKPGKYTATLKVYGPNGLTGTYTQEVTVRQPEATIKTDLAEGCIGHTPTLSAVAKNTSSYTWDMGDGSIVHTTDTFAKYQYTKPGSYTPILIMSDGNSCTASSTSTDKIIIRPDPVATVSPAAPVLCLGATVTLQAGGGVSYAWSPADGLSRDNIASPIASPVTSTTYTVQVADDIGCKNTGTVTVKVVSPVTVQLPAAIAICAGNPITLQATGAVLYTWIFNTTGLDKTDIPDPVARPATSTRYTVKGSDAYNCFSDTAGIDVMVNPLPTVNAGIDVEAMPGAVVPLSPVYSNDVVRWNWSPAQYLNCVTCATPVSKPMSQTMYKLTVYNQYKCPATDSVLIKMICEESRVGIPNAFSPNRDGVNDVWTIKGISLIKHLVIFNRWGQKVFERNNFIAADRASCWDGTFNGYDAPPGTYVYFAEMECPTGGVFARKGTVVLTR